jgi:HEPN domain-containing protein
MQNQDLAKDYIKRAKIRLESVALLLSHESYADVVREAQECVELALKALLRKSGIQPPRIHDVSAIMLEQKALLPTELGVHLEKLAKISKNLRRDRELAFYGSEDLTPSDFYSRSDAESALADAQFVVTTVLPFVLSA